MNPTRTLAAVAAIAAIPLLTLGADAASLSPSSKLDRWIEPVAVATEQHREGGLMNQALQRQSNHSNSPLEVRWNEAGAVQVSLNYDRNGQVPDIAALKSLGATGILQSPALSLIQAWVPAAELRAVSTLPGVLRVSLPRYAVHKRITSTGPLHYTSSVDPEGDSALGASQFRAKTGITGQGISVGVISDGDDHIADSQKSGDLPATIVNDPNDAGSFKSKGDEGTAMMEIVYTLAPGVKQLAFCGPATQADFLTCLDDFAANGSNVVVDDLGFQGGAMFSDDSFNTSVQQFATAHPGIRLVTAAGNDAQGYWQGTWNSPAAISGSTTVNGITYTQAANFGTASAPVAYLQIRLPSNQLFGDTLAYIVEWNDPWTDDPKAANDTNDYDVVVFNNTSGDASGTSGHLAVACNQGMNASVGANSVPSTSTTCNQANSQDTTSPGPQPIQGSVWVASQPNYYLEVFLHHGNPGANLKVMVLDTTNPFPIDVIPVTAGSIFGHATLSGEITTAAFDAQQPGFVIEPFSSTGPVEYGITGSATQSLQKPDFAGPDDVTVSGAGGFSTPFFGTSAAAPHIAGLVALLMSGYPGANPSNLLVKASTQPIGTGFNGTFGNGVPVLTNLLSANVLPSPVATISAPTGATTLTTGQQLAFAGSCSSGSASGTATLDWNFGSGSGIADSTSAAPSVMFNTAGNFTVTLKCTNSAGSGTATAAVTVNAPPSKGGGDLDLLILSGLGLIYLRRRARR